MKLPEQYALALIQVGREQDSKAFDAFFVSFIEYLKAHHHEKLLPRILSAVERFGNSTAAANQTTITVGKEGAEQDFKEVIAAYIDTFGTDSQVRVDPNIVGGVMIRNRTNLLDESYRTGLLKLYETLRK